MIHRIRGAASLTCLMVPRALRVACGVAFLSVLLAGSTSAAPRVVSVTAVSAPIMDAAAADAQELGRASKGTRLTASGRTSGDWLQIQAPAFVSGWVYGELVRDSLIAASSVKVRSGPGIGYADLGVLTRGDAVVVRGRRGDWIEIEGMPSLVAWVERALVAEGAAVDLTATTKPPVSPAPPAAPVAPPPTVVVPDPPAPEPVEQLPPPVAAPPVVVARPAPPVSLPPPEPKPVTPPPVVAKPVQTPVRPVPSVVPPVPAAPPVVPAGRAVPPPRTAPALAGSLSPVGVRLLASAPQGEPVVVSGELRPVGVALFPPAPYRLVAASGNGPARTLCYVASERPLPLPGTAVRLQGLKYWVYGSRQPVVLVREMTVFPGLTVTN
jgi:hypothetical protein